MKLDTIKIIARDITTLKVDAIVNAANKAMLGGKGVDGAIHAAAGPALRDECEKVNGCATGHVRITGAYELPCRYVIHTVGPIFENGRMGESQALESCYRKSLEMALDYGFRSIAFPSISTGVYGYPFDTASTIALATAMEYTYRFDEIIFACFPAENADKMKAIYQQMSGK